MTGEFRPEYVHHISLSLVGTCRKFVVKKIYELVSNEMYFKLNYTINPSVHGKAEYWNWTFFLTETLGTYVGLYNLISNY